MILTADETKCVRGCFLCDPIRKAVGFNVGIPEWRLDNFRGRVNNTIAACPGKTLILVPENETEGGFWK